jgi:hypothetical protein
VMRPCASGDVRKSRMSEISGCLAEHLRNDSGYECVLDARGGDVV